MVAVVVVVLVVPAVSLVVETWPGAAAEIRRRRRGCGGSAAAAAPHRRCCFVGSQDEVELVGDGGMRSRQGRLGLSVGRMYCGFSKRAVRQGKMQQLRDGSAKAQKSGSSCWRHRPAQG